MYVDTQGVAHTHPGGQSVCRDDDRSTCVPQRLETLLGVA